MRANSGTGHSGAIREGSSLLQGIAICGKCGRKMTLRYSNSINTKQPVYACDHYRRHLGEEPCQYVSGGNIDLTIESLLLDIINPLTIDAALSIQREMAGRKEEILQLYSQQLERARHDMDLAKRRYLAVDPGNRLVAAELEYDWNKKVIAFESAKETYEQKCEAEIRIVDEEMNISLAQMVSDFPKIWNDPRTSNREKKRIAGHILEDVTISSDSPKIVLGVRFKSGATKILEIPKVSRNLNLINREKEAVSEIKALIHMDLTYREIAIILNDKGMLYGLPGKPFDAYAVTSLIYRYGLPKKTDIVLSNKEQGWLTAKQKIAELGIDKSKFYRMRKAGRFITKECSYHGACYLYKAEAINTVPALS
jgi:hypothetical protein